MKINSKDFRVREGDKVKLKKWPTRVKPVYQSKEAYQELLAQPVAELSDLQQLHYASNRYAVLLIFQAMDAAGKDGAIHGDEINATIGRRKQHRATPRQGPTCMCVRQRLAQ